MSKKKQKTFWQRIWAAVPKGIRTLVAGLGLAAFEIAKLLHFTPADELKKWEVVYAIAWALVILKHIEIKVDEIDEIEERMEEKLESILPSLRADAERAKDIHQAIDAVAVGYVNTGRETKHPPGGATFCQQEVARELKRLEVILRERRYPTPWDSTAATEYAERLYGIPSLKRLLITNKDQVLPDGNLDKENFWCLPEDQRKALGKVNMIAAQHGAKIHRIFVIPRGIKKDAKVNLEIDPKSNDSKIGDMYEVLKSMDHDNIILELMVEKEAHEALKTSGQTKILGLQDFALFGYGPEPVADSNVWDSHEWVAGIYSNSTEKMDDGTMIITEDTHETQDLYKSFSALVKASRVRLNPPSDLPGEPRVRFETKWTKQQFTDEVYRLSA